MYKKYSIKWLYLSFFIILLLSILGIIVTATSYRNTHQHSLEMGLTQLDKVNDYVIKILTLELDAQTDLLNDLGKQMATNQERTQLLDDNQILNKLFDAPTSIIRKIYLLSPDGKFLDGRKQSKNGLTTLDYLPETYTKDSLFYRALQGEVLGSGKEYFDDHSSYINIYYPIVNDNQQIESILMVPINLNQFFNEKIAQKEDSLQGYTMVKNENMEVIMHPSTDQIGLSIVDGRKKEFPKLDYSDLEKLEQQQRTNDHGTVAYYSYWWTSKNLEKVLKMTAFQWITIGETRWIVASNADFREVSGLKLQESLIVIGLLAILLAIILSILINFRNYIRRNQAYQENQRLLAIQELQKEKHNVEKTLLQESKLETIGLLTTSIVHDMNNFLTPLIGNLQLLMDEHKDNPELIEDLKEIYQAAQKGQKLSKNVLRFSKVAPESKETLDIGSVVSDAISVMKLLLPNEDIINLEIKTTGPAIFEKDDLQGILYNLIINAFQAMGSSGKIIVSVEKCTESDIINFQNYHSIYRNNKFLLLKIQDTGPGIPKEIENKIFTPFFTTRTSDGGTGLGLFIVSSLIKKNNWLLKLETSPKGSIFSIAIPLENSDTKGAVT
jgi:signal transduction histidine kinase